MSGKKYTGEEKYNIIMESFQNPSITIASICRKHGIAASMFYRWKKHGVLVVDPEYDDTKAKIADNDRIIDYLCRSVFGNDLVGKNVLIIAGRSESPIDPVRVITNRSSG